MQLIRLIDAVTPEERNKIMGHRKGDSSTYLTYYMSNFIDADCQSICFGSAPRRDIVILAAQLRYHSGAPKSLTTDQLADIEADKDLTRYRREKTLAKEEWKQQGYRSREDAAGTNMRKQYDKYNTKAISRRQKLKVKSLRLAIEEFHRIVHIEEVDRQLEGSKPAAEVIAPSDKTYEIPERAQIALLFSKLADAPDRESIYCIRVELVNVLVALAQQREDPVKLASKRGLKSSASRQAKLARQGHADSSVSVANSKGPKPTIKSASLFHDPRYNCPFCQSRGFESRFGRIDVLARHIRQHLRKKSGPFRCPWRDCISFLADSEHFAGHADREHGLKLPPQVLRK